jgi:hypothetical protein
MSRREILHQYGAYAREVETKQGKRARTALVKPILQLFSGERESEGEVGAGWVQSPHNHCYCVLSINVQ